VKNGLVTRVSQQKLPVQLDQYPPYQAFEKCSLLSASNGSMKYNSIKISDQDVLFTIGILIQFVFEVFFLFEACSSAKDNKF
jgi:hypothetical protein